MSRGSQRAALLWPALWPECSSCSSGRRGRRCGESHSLLRSPLSARSLFPLSRRRRRHDSIEAKWGRRRKRRRSETAAGRLSTACSLPLRLLSLLLHLLGDSRLSPCFRTSRSVAFTLLKNPKFGLFLLSFFALYCWLCLLRPSHHVLVDFPCMCAKLGLQQLAILISSTLTQRLLALSHFSFASTSCMSHYLPLYFIFTVYCKFPIMFFTLLTLLNTSGFVEWPDNCFSRPFSQPFNSPAPQFQGHVLLGGQLAVRLFACARKFAWENVVPWFLGNSRG